MKIMLRNREFRQFAILFCVTAIIMLISGFAVNFMAGMLILVSAALFWILFYLFTRGRYERIAQVSEQIDLVLHNADHLFIAQEEEGELSILQSEVVKMTQRIREQNRALKREKGHLAESLADIAHQLRTPLTSANLALSILENSPDADGKKELLLETKELFSQMDWLLTSLLKLSRLDAGVVEFQKEQIDARGLIDAAVRPLLLSMDLHNITLQTDVPEGIFVYGDARWLSEAIQNIIKNCMDSIGDNGKIEIRCGDNSLFTEITIRDNGAGIAKEDLPHLFDRFYRGKNSAATGYGIGLALCRTTILRQGGTITAKNHPQGGAVFTICFSK